MGFGAFEMLAILAIVLLIFGAGKLPGVMGDLAKGVRNFKAGLKDEPETGPAAPAVPPRLAPPRAPTATGGEG